jgi:hypothetical protein
VSMDPSDELRDGSRGGAMAEYHGGSGSQQRMQEAPPC